MYVTDTDSGRLQQIQEDCALDLRLDGFEDGFTGKLAQSSAFEYVLGYIQGIARGIQEDQVKAARFEEFRQREAAQKAGQPDWLDEVMQDNDEPTLQYDEF